VTLGVTRWSVEGVTRWSDEGVTRESDAKSDVVE